jgi:hypothetical protein
MHRNTVSSSRNSQDQGLTEDSFSYLELYLSVSQVLKNYCLKPGEYSFISADTEATLPPRLEWVAAVPTTTLGINLQKRYS